MNMKYQKLINSNIKALRIREGLTQEEFAERIDISIQGVSNIERNRYQPTAETVDKICSAFNITPAELLVINSNVNQDIIKNISTLLSQCSNKKLKTIYEVVLTLIRNI